MHGMKPTSLPQPVVDASEEGSIQMSSPSNSPSQGSPMMGVGSSPKLMKDEPLLRGTSMALLEFSSVMHPEDSKAQLKDHAQTMLQKIKHEDVLVRVVQMLENTVDSTTTTSSPSTDGPTSSHSHSPHSGSRGQETSEALSRSTGATYASRQESFHQPKRNNVARCSDASNALQRFQDELNKRSHSVETFSDRDSIPFMEEEKGGDDTSTAYSPNEAAGKRRDRGVSFVGSNEDYHHDPSKRRSTWGSSMMMEDPLCSSAHCLPMRAGRREAISGAPISLPFSGTASPVSVISLTLPNMSKTEMDFVRKAVESWNDFEDLDEDDLQALAAGMKEEICPAGSTLCEEGNSSTEKIYLLVEGTCTVVRMSKPVATIHPGEFIATRELMYSGASCSSTIQCVTRCVFYALEEELYRGFICASSQKRRERYAGLVQGSPFLQTLDEKGRLILAEALVSSTFAKGDPIIKFGEKGMKMHFILDGEVRVVGRQSGKKVEVLRLGKGEVVGELEFLFNHLAVADVIAASESVTTAFISRAHFEMLFGEIQERLKEYVATNVLYQEYYRNGIANKSVMKELQRFEQSHSHHDISSSPQSSPTTAAKANTTNLSNNNNKTAVTSGNRPGELFPPPVVTPHRVSPLNKHGEIVLLAPSTDIRLSTSMETSARRGGELTTPAPPPDLFHFALPQILLSTGVALIGLREDGLILVWSETMVRLTNYAAEDVVGLNIYTFLANEAEQRSMHAAIEDVQLRSGDGSPTLKVTHTASTINNTYTFTRSDGLTRVRLRLQLFFPVEAPESRNMLLAAGEEIKQDPRRALEQPLWLSSHLRTILLDEGFSYEERLQLIAERISSFEVMHRAMSVSMDTLRVVDVREMVGQMVMDFGSECVQRGVSVSQCYDGLTSELAYLDPQRLPECLRYAMNLCLKLPDCSELSITCSLADSSGVELLIIHFDVDGAGFPDAFVKLLDMPLPAANPEKDLVLGCSTSREEQLLLLRARKAVEQQGATMRLRNCDGASNLIFIIPYLPVDGGDDGWNQSISDDEDDFRGDGTAPEDACSTTVVGGDSLQATRGFSMVLEPTQGPEVSQQNFTTLVAEDLPSHRNVICGFLWRRRHAVLPAYNLADVERLAGVADILIIDPHQSILANLPTADPIALLREKTHRMAVIVTGRGMDAATSEAYTRAGFIPLNKNCTPHEAMQAIRLAEDRVKAAKVEAQRIATARETLAKNSRGAWERGKLLGKGSFGEVFLAVDVLTGGTMAVKEMRLDNSNLKLENFIAEISTMCSLQHPHIIHYFYCEQDAERHTLRVFMEYAAGGTLQGLLSRKEKLDFAEYQSLLRDITEGLAYIHHHRYVHGDIKTANVLLDNGNRGKIGDFGTARTLAEGKLIFEMQGSPLYMSPECMSAGEVDEDGEKIGYSFPSDIWSLGCVAMEMATNRPPFSHVSSVKGPAGLTQYVTSLHDIPDLSPLFEWPPSVVEFVAACLNPDPLRRATAQELLEFSIFSDGSDEDTKSAMKALKRAQLLHVLNKFVAFQDPEEVEQLQMEHQQRLRGCQRNCTDFFDSSSSSGSSSSRSTKHSSSSDDEDDDEFERLTKKHVGRRAAMKEAQELEKGESITSPDLQHLETAAFPTSDDRTASMADDAPHQVVEHTFEPSSTTLTATSQAFSAHSDCDDLSLESGASFHKLEFANASPLRARAASHSSSNARLATSFFGTSMDVLHSAANRFLQHLGEERRPIHVNTNINVSNNNNNTSAKDGHAPLQLSATIPDTSVASLMSSDPLNSTTRIRQSPKSLFMVKVKKRFQMGESSIDSRRPNLSFFHTRAATSSPPTTPGVSAGVGAATRTKITCSPKSSPHNSRQQASHHSMSVQSALKDAFSELGELLHHGGKQRGSASASASHPASPDVSRESGAAVSSTITPASTAFEDASFSTSAGDVSEATSPGVSPQGAEDEVESSNSIKKTNAMRNIMRHVKHLKKYISDLKEHSIHDE